MNGRPLISFVLSCYNQEAFIRAAVDGALLQTYCPLEIIVSDDGSSDRTFDIVQQIVAEYRGPHVIRLNQNEKNLGIAAHLNRSVGRCTGALIVIAAGDDISLPTRTEVTYAAWEQSGRQATSISSSYTTISEDGTERGKGGSRGDPADSRPIFQLDGDLFEFVSTGQPMVCGCSHAFTPELFAYFGPLQSDLEDLVLSFRTLAIGQMLYIRQPLVKYRRHRTNLSLFEGADDSTSFAHRENRLRWMHEQTIRAYDNMLLDTEILCRKGRISSAQRDRLSAQARRIRDMHANLEGA